MFKRIAVASLIIAFAYFTCIKLNLGDVSMLLYAYGSYVSYELLGVRANLSRFRSPLLAITAFFTIKFILQIVFNLPIPLVKFEIPEFELFAFLISLSLVWVNIGRYQPILAGVGLILSAYFGYSLLSAIPFKEVQELRTLLVVVLAILALTTVLPMYRRFESLVEWRGFLIATAVIVFVYSTFIRPLLIDRPGLVNFFDWLIVMGVFLKAVGKVRMEVVESEILELHRRHEVRSEEITDELEKAKKEFLERGDKVLLLTALIRYLSDAGLDTTKIAEIVEPIIRHEDRKVPKFAFGWEKNWIRDKNAKRREEVLKIVLERLKEVKA